MARSRNIKPGLFKNADLAECSIWARYVFCGLWTLADREGRLEDRPKQIKGELLPYDGQDVEPLLAELHQRKFLVRYQNSDGSFIQISKFLKHQSPHYSEKVSVIKPQSLPETSIHGATENPGTLPEHSGKDGPIKRGSQPPDSLIPSSLIPDTREKAMSGKAPDPPQLEKQKSNGAYTPDAEKVLNYLNHATGRTYRFRNPNGKLTPNADVIVARLGEGYTTEQLKEVVLLKSEKWKGDEKMAEYLRPSTLFGKQKFAQYVGELGA